MVNFAIPGTGSSGHLAGGTLLALLLGPSAAFLVLASVLTVQALFFADGGLLALGCNLFNLGFWPACVGLALHRRIVRALPGRAGASLGAVSCAVVSLELGALGVVVQTALSGRAEVPFANLALLMLGIHLPIALVEGVVTAGVVRFLTRLAPDRVAAAGGAGPRIPALAALAGVALFLGTVGASLASARPDGLEWSLARTLPLAAAPHRDGVGGWLAAAQERIALFPDYAFPGSAGARRGGLDPGASASGIVGGLLAAAAVLGLALGARGLRRLRAPAAVPPRGRDA
jgi:cobalt/nickel transport system permease protein